MFQSTKADFVPQSGSKNSELATTKNFNCSNFLGPIQVISGHFKLSFGRRGGVLHGHHHQRLQVRVLLTSHQHSVQDLLLFFLLQTNPSPNLENMCPQCSKLTQLILHK